MMLPRWIPFLIAAWVIAFGILRLRIAMRKDDAETSDRPNYRKGGYYARSKRSHMLFGISYLVLGAYCIAMGFGYQIDIVGSCRGQESRTKTDSTGGQGVPVDVAPTSK
jgi:hypothetical protein